ncbi:hypothetical protein MKL09_09770 [Methylobacterium sp. J-048]|uniref:hypothetical protein n=1 Tax=Methylobacterium sp. J-048 TaxID=2836635 RepID=UPI001FBABA93|nr:hypothetical protein [Methylobacterium sp. J-048]MCJ2056841.1 hypothetical protein [Methylobacterium sp. J-048]
MSTAPEICIVAIDPGLTGAVAFYFPAYPERVSVDDMPVVNGEVDAHALERRIRQLAPALAAVERQGPQPRDGCKQAFGIGAAYATAKTVATLCHLPVHLVTPSVWKRHHGILGAADPKEAGRALALRLFPASAESFSRKKDHGRSDAALLARFAADTISRGGAE